jgi:hypothetical protein
LTFPDMLSGNGNIGARSSEFVQKLIAVNLG